MMSSSGAVPSFITCSPCHRRHACCWMRLRKSVTLRSSTLGETMKRLALLAALTFAVCTVAHAQYQGQYSSNPYAQQRVNPYASGGNLYTNDGEYRGTANGNQYDPNSTSNPYGRYGSKYSSDSINNQYGAGSPYRSDSPSNPYGSGLKVCGIYGCD